MPPLLHLYMSEFINPKRLRALRAKQATPNLQLANIPLSHKESFELWMPKWIPKGRVFSKLEIELLRRDQPRVTKILSKMVWLMGAVCICEDDWDVGDRRPIYDWDDLIEFVKLEGNCVNPIVTKVIFTPHAIIPIYDSERKQEGRIPPQAWEIAPSHWSIIFDDLIPTREGLRLKQSADWISVDIWTGKPMRKEVGSGKLYVEYHDLYASRRN